MIIIAKKQLSRSLNCSSLKGKLVGTIIISLFLYYAYRLSCGIYSAEGNDDYQTIDYEAMKKLETTPGAPPVPPYVYTSVQRNSKADGDLPVKDHELPLFQDLKGEGEEGHYDKPDEGLIGDLIRLSCQSLDEIEKRAGGSLKSPQHAPLPPLPVDEDGEGYYATAEAVEDAPITHKHSSSSVDQAPTASEYSCIQETPTPAAEGQASRRSTDIYQYASSCQSLDEIEKRAGGLLKSPQHAPLPPLPVDEDGEGYYATPESVEEAPITHKYSSSSVDQAPIASEYSCIQETPTPAAEGQANRRSTDTYQYASSCQSLDEIEKRAGGSLKSPQHAPLPPLLADEDGEGYYATAEAVEDAPCTHKHSSSSVDQAPIASEYSFIQEIPITSEYSYADVTNRKSSQEGNKFEHVSDAPTAKGQASSSRRTDTYQYASVDKYKKEKDQEDQHIRPPPQRLP